MSLALPILDTQLVRPLYAQGPRDLAAVKLLRLSITDRCNFRCVYCMPDEGVDFAPAHDLLTPADILAVASAAHSIGISSFKVTGGEPTVRPDLLEIVAGLAALDSADLSLTTNGLLLDRLAHDLRRAGLHRLTVSWDSMHADRFHAISGGRGGTDGLARFRRGLDAAQDAGFTRLKINTVIIGGTNDDEILDFAALTLDHPWTVRFIEYMPLGTSELTTPGPSGTSGGYTVDNEDIAQRIAAHFGALLPVHRPSEPGVGPAQVFQIPGAKGRIGFISAMSRPFCETCNRLRLTATGQLRACLFDGGEIDILPALRPQPNRPALLDMMRQCVALKPETHSPRGNRPMSQLGG